MNYHKLKVSRIYREQRRFVVFDCGSAFAARYGVLGLSCNNFRLTKYFNKSEDAVAYFLKVAGEANVSSITAGKRKGIYTQRARRSFLEKKKRYSTSRSKYGA